MLKFLILIDVTRETLFHTVFSRYANTVYDGILGRGLA